MKYIFLLFFLIFSKLNATVKNENNIPFSTIENMIKDLEEDPRDQWSYIILMINKAKRENNLQKLHRAYSFASTYSREGTQEKYGDSLLQTAFKLNDSDVIGDCYLARGMIFTNQEKYTAALDAFIKGYSFIEKKGDPYLINNAEYQIAQTKIYLGQYKEANKILKNVVSFFRINHKRINDTDYGLYYIYALIAYIDSNSHLNNFSENKILINEGFNFIKTNKDYSDYYSYFVSLEGTDAYYQKNYSHSIQKLKLALQLSDDNWKHLTENFYLGLAYWYSGEKESAIPYLLKIHQEYDKSKKLDPQFRPAIELLIEYYKLKNDPSKQLLYINDLIILDKMYEKNYKAIFSSLHKNYDTQNLIEERNSLKKALRKGKINHYILIIFSISAILIISYFTRNYYKRQKHYKKLYEMVENKVTIDNKSLPSEKIVLDEPIDDLQLDINPLIVDNILDFLENFEREKKFLNKECSLISIAKECGTNTSYLSKIVNHYKGENFISYLNTLRIKYVIEQWKNKPKMRHHTLQEIADLSGFNTAQSFSKNFQDRYKISPKFFLKKLNQESASLIDKG